MFTGEHAGAARGAGGDRLADRTVLLVVPGIEVVELGTRDPCDLADERPPRALRDPLDVRRARAAA